MKKNNICKKVLVFGLNSKVGGVENFYFEYYKTLKEKDYKIDFVTKDKSIMYKEEILKKGGTVYIIPKLKENPIKHYLELKHIFKTQKYDIVHANLSYASNILNLKLAKKYGVKQIIVHSHNSGFNNNIITRFLHYLNKNKLKKYATHFLACSEKAGKWMFGEKTNFTVFNNAIDKQKFIYDEKTRKNIRKELKIKDEYVIGHVGRMCYQKNQEFLLVLMKKLVKYNPNFKLILIGSGKNEKKIKDLIKKLNLERYVIIIQSNEAYKYYNAFDMFVLPSRYEGWGIVAIEAQVNGLPCLFSDKVSKDVKINNNVEFLSLKDNYKWIECIKSYKNRTNKINDKIDDYDINKISHKLDDIYQNKMNIV